MTRTKVRTDRTAIRLCAFKRATHGHRITSVINTQTREHVRRHTLAGIADLTAGLARGTDRSTRTAVVGIGVRVPARAGTAGLAGSARMPTLPAVALIALGIGAGVTTAIGSAT